MGETLRLLFFIRLWLGRHVTGSRCTSSFSTHAQGDSAGHVAGSCSKGAPVVSGARHGMRRRDGLFGCHVPWFYANGGLAADPQLLSGYPGQCGRASGRRDHADMRSKRGMFDVEIHPYPSGCRASPEGPGHCGGQNDEPCRRGCARASVAAGKHLHHRCAD